MTPGRLTRAALAADLAEHVFATPSSASLTPRRVGAEVDLIPVESATGRRCPIEGGPVLPTLPFLRRFGLSAADFVDAAAERAAASRLTPEAWM